MNVTFLLHAEEKMQELGITEEDVLAVLETPDDEYSSPRGKRRFVAERLLLGKRKVTKVVYNKESDEYVVVTVMLGRPSRRDY